MCGIAGYVGIKKYYPSKSQINSCIKLMKLRGPDFQDTKNLEFGKFRSLFCSSRLSIIDMHDRSNQPIEDDEGVLTFNGEIYNYIELKKDLIKKKISFNTKSDTEVLLKYLNFFGVKKLNKLHGMWSFAYYSKKYKKIYLSRDIFGEKPIFFSLDKKKKTFIYGSNINYIRKLCHKPYQINEEKIYDYLKFGYRSIYSENKTFFKNVNFLNPGQLIEIDKNFNLKFINYKKLKKYNPEINNYNLGKKILRQKINYTIPKTFRSDVPIAFFLSGGIDSSILSYLAKKKLKKTKFFSLRQKDKKYDESKNIDLIKKSLKLKHEYVKISSKKKNLNIIHKLIKDTGFPLLSTTNLAIYEICKKAKEQGYKVIISGNGADEIFSGYYVHHLSYLISLKNKKNFKTEFKKWSNQTRPFIRTEILKNLRNYEKNFKKQGYNFETNLYEKYFKIFKKKKLSNNLINKKKDFFIQHLDNDLFYDTLPSQAHNIDNISMHNSIESRMPYLNFDLYNLRNSMNKSFLIKNGLAKYILRDIFLGKIPKQILLNPEKTGFFLPLNETVNFKSKKFIKTILECKFLNKIIKLNNVKKILIDKNLSQQDQKFIFLLYNAALFIKLYS